MKVIQVKWLKPPFPSVKLNTNGSVISNLRKIGTGGIIRDYKGNKIYAFIATLGIGSKN